MSNAVKRRGGVPPLTPPRRVARLPRPQPVGSSMSPEENESGSEFLSAQDMRNWAQREIKDVAKAHELRMQELMNLVGAYSAGEISAEKADELKERYHHRWGDALPRRSATEGATDDQLLAGIDQAANALNGPFVSPTESRARLLERQRRTPDDLTRSRNRS